MSNKQAFFISILLLIPSICMGLGTYKYYSISQEMIERQVEVSKNLSDTVIILSRISHQLEDRIMQTTSIVKELEEVVQ